MKWPYFAMLISVAVIVSIFQILPGSKAAGTPASYLLVRRVPESFKNDSPAPSPTPAGTVHIPLPAETYPLTCRGGGSLVIGIAPGERNIGFVFTRGTKPAGITLAPGECSWTDRGMHADEPDRVSQHVEEGSESLKVGRALAPENKWYDELHFSDKYWTFQVYNNGKGQLIARSAQPNKRMDVSPTARVPSDLEELKTPRSYPLLCRGSESLKIAFTPTIRAIGFKFTRGIKPAGEGLDPGECSWVARGMYADEPDELSQPVEDNWESLDKGEGGRLLPPETRWYEELRSSRKSWRFMVYRQRSVLRVTSAGSHG